jgi:dihydrofolate reductase
MARLRVHSFGVSLDGYGAGPSQSIDDGLGVGGERLHEWLFSPDNTEVDRDFFQRGIDGIGATVMGRNMFGPVRGEWPDESWKGWWGDEPPYHHPVFVLTHHARPSFEMAGGTTFHFVTDGLDSALAQAFDAAGGQDVRLGGGVSVVQQALHAGRLDWLHLAVVPILLGGGERLLDGVGTLDDFECTELVSCRNAVTHVVLEKRS